MKTHVWFERGLQFECQPDCGACCIRHDDFSLVYLNSNDAVRLAVQLDLPLESFLERYAVLQDGELTLRMEGDRCTFLEGTKCRVHPGRPLQCRSFPFWPRFLRNPGSWAALQRFCPGIDMGLQHDATEIRDVADRFKKSCLED